MIRFTSLKHRSTVSDVLAHCRNLRTDDSVHTLYIGSCNDAQNVVVRVFYFMYYVLINLCNNYNKLYHFHTHGCLYPYSLIGITTTMSVCICMFNFIIYLYITSTIAETDDSTQWAETVLGRIMIIRLP